MGEGAGGIERGVEAPSQPRPGVLALPVLYPGLEARVTVARWASGVSAKCLVSSRKAPGKQFGWFLESARRWAQRGQRPLFVAKYLSQQTDPSHPVPCLLPRSGDPAGALA